MYVNDKISFKINVGIWFLLKFIDFEIKTRFNSQTCYAVFLGSPIKQNGYFNHKV